MASIFITPAEPFPNIPSLLQQVPLLVSATRQWYVQTLRWEVKATNKRHKWKIVLIEKDSEGITESGAAFADSAETLASISSLIKAKTHVIFFFFFFGLLMCDNTLGLNVSLSGFPIMHLSTSQRRLKQIHLMVLLHPGFSGLRWKLHINIHAVANRKFKYLSRSPKRTNKRFSRSFNLQSCTGLKQKWHMQINLDPTLIIWINKGFCKRKPFEDFVKLSELVWSDTETEGAGK